MAENTLPIVTLILRLFTFVFLLVALIVLATNKIKDISLFADSKNDTTFSDVYAYRFMLAVDVIGCAYILMQLPFAVLHITVGKGSDSKLKFWHFTDPVFALLLAAGAGAGYGLTVEIRERLLDDDEPKEITKFFGLELVSTSFLLMATACMGLTILVSTYSLAKK